MVRPCPIGLVPKVALVATVKLRGETAIAIPALASPRLRLPCAVPVAWRRWVSIHTSSGVASFGPHSLVAAMTSCGVGGVRAARARAVSASRSRPFVAWRSAATKCSAGVAMAGRRRGTQAP